MATSTDRPPRPRVRVLHADPDQKPVLVIDRWTGSPDDFAASDMREAGFSGVLVFSQDVDLDDDGLDDANPEHDAQLAAVLDAARRVARTSRDTGAPLPATVAERVGALKGALDRLDEIEKRAIAGRGATREP